MYLYKFLQILSEHGLLQHVSGPTHVHGHTLDVLITRENSSLLLGLPSIRDPRICDNKGNPQACVHAHGLDRLHVAKVHVQREFVRISERPCHVGHRCENLGLP
jgi:hypothetical protein